MQSWGECLQAPSPALQPAWPRGVRSRPLVSGPRQTLPGGTCLPCTTVAVPAAPGCTCLPFTSCTTPGAPAAALTPRTPPACAPLTPLTTHLESVGQEIHWEDIMRQPGHRLGRLRWLGGAYNCQTGPSVTNRHGITHECKAGFDADACRFICVQVNGCQSE